MSEDNKETIGVFYDLENCGVANFKTGIDSIIGSLQIAFPNTQVRVHAFCAEEGIIKDFQKEECRSAKFTTLHNVPGEAGSGENLADYALMCEMFLFAMSNRQSALIMLISGDNDYTHPMKTLNDLGFKTVMVSRLKNAGAEVMKVCKHIELKDFLKGEIDLLELVGEEDVNAVGVNEGTFQNAGVFVDVDSVKIEGVGKLVEDVGQLVESVAGEMTFTFKAYGQSFNFPKDVKEFLKPVEDVRESYVMKETSKSKRKKYDSLENNMITGILKFAFEYGRSSFIIVITTNPEIERASNTLRAAGFQMTLKRTLHDQLL